MGRLYFCISDLHLADAGPRDNFHAIDHRLEDLFSFLDYAVSENACVVVLGDLFELWQCNVSKTLNVRFDVIEKLEQVGAWYVLGNHDIDLKYFLREVEGGGKISLDHVLFRRCTTGIVLSLAVSGESSNVHLKHGHEFDPSCADEDPGLGRVSAIYTALKEDRNRNPYKGSRSVENATLGRFDRVSRAVRWLLGHPSRLADIHNRAVDYALNARCSVVFGHTHEAGRVSRGGELMPVYNCGTWCRKDVAPSFVRVDETGIRVFDWVRGRPVPNEKVLHA